MLKAAWDFFCNLWNAIKPNYFWLFVLIGIAFVIAASMADFYPDLHGAFNTIGVSVLTSGVFAGVLKSFQFVGIFQTELKNLFGSGPFVKDLQELALYGHPDVDPLERIFERTIAGKHPKLKDEIAQSIPRFLKADYRYYFGRYWRTITILAYHPDTGIIEFTDDYEFTIVPACNCDYESVIKGAGFKSTSTTINVLRVTTVSAGPAAGAATTTDLLTTAQRNGSELKLKFAMKLGKRYVLRRVINYHFRLSDDPMIFQQFKRVCKDIDIVIVNKAENAISSDITFVNYTEQIEVETNLQEKRYQSSGLTFPHQGYIITLIPIIGGTSV